MRRRVTTSGAWIQHGPPAPWMLLYAQWLIQHPEAELSTPKGERAKRTHRPTSLERQARATALACRRMDRRLITLLERREDFRVYFERMRADAQFQAQELLRSDITENIEARRAGLRKAVDRQVDDEGNVTFGENVDHRAVERYTHPFVDLAFPKKLEREQPPRTITIQIGSLEARRLLAQALSKEEEPQDIEWEAIPSDRQLTDGDDD